MIRQIHDRDRPVSPPFTPLSFAHLLDHDPPRAAAILGAMRPPLRAAQAQAHAAFVDKPADQVRATWRTLMHSVVFPCPPIEDAVQIAPHGRVTSQRTKGA